MMKQSILLHIESALFTGYKDATSISYLGTEPQLRSSEMELDSAIFKRQLIFTLGGQP